MYNMKKLALLLILILALSIGFVGASAQSPADQPTVDLAAATETVSRENNAAGIAAVEKLWDREARRAARAPDWTKLDIKDDVGNTTSERVGEPASVPAAMPHPQADREARRLYPNEWRDAAPAGSAETQSDIGIQGTAGVFTRYAGNLYTQMWQYYPWRAIGKLYFTPAGGGSSYCTASVIGTRTIVTAAHCVYTRGSGWNSNWSFCPADRYGSTPYGCFSWQSATVLNAWITDGGRRWDVAVLNLNTDANGRNVSYYTGYLGRSWNYPYVQSLHAVGYASNLSTQYQNICAAESYYGGSTDVIDMGCDMTYGSSGGPWIRVYTPYQSGAMNYVNAVTSGPGTIFGTTIRGPRFSDNNIVPLCNAAGC